ncbi:MAG TPA: HAD family hydrolase [Gemmatimonadaceae bacterium]|nr:HAD family hydrolase [Gemmatimonadaceae bacterium]
MSGAPDELRPAAFLDRDGTLIHDRHYISRADDVELLPGASAAVRALNDAGVPVILVSNQSGIGRGYFTRAEYERVHARLAALLAEEGARLDAVYICPHAPPPRGEPACECRKPGTLLFRQAARDHAIDLTVSWGIGDRWRDLAPVIALGGRGVLVPQRDSSTADVRRAREAALVVPTIGEAAALVLASLPSRRRAAGGTSGGTGEGVTERGSPR